MGKLLYYPFINIKLLGCLIIFMLVGLISTVPHSYLQLCLVVLDSLKSHVSISSNTTGLHLHHFCHVLIHRDGISTLHIVTPLTVETLTTFSERMPMESMQPVAKTELLKYKLT